MGMEDYIFNYLIKVSNSNFLNYAKTDDHYSISGITSLYLLKEILTMLSIQDEYEVFVETQRSGEILIYSIAGTKKKK